MFRVICHDRKDVLNKVVRHTLVEQVGHGVDKDKSRLAPQIRELEDIRVKS